MNSTSNWTTNPMYIEGKGKIGSARVLGIPSFILTNYRLMIQAVKSNENVGAGCTKQLSNLFLCKYKLLALLNYI